MQFNAELLLLAMAPVFPGCTGWEAWHPRRMRPAARFDSWRDALCNTALALMQQATDKLAWLAIIRVYAFFRTHYRNRIHRWQPAWVSFVVLFVAHHLPEYRFHRYGHPMRWLRAARVAHHSSERINSSTAFRQSVMYPVACVRLFQARLATLGFAPQKYRARAS
jgi:sterol desaturase/sphingolipid hydroxylase (fatty acid hydroxylase superfamily)